MHTANFLKLRGGLIIFALCMAGRNLAADEIRSNLPAQPGADLAAARDLVVREVLAGDAGGRELAAWPALADAARGSLRNWRGPVAMPWQQCWVFQVDDAPTANWEHPCRYVFVKPDLSALIVRDARSPLAYNAAGPAVREGNGTQPLTVIIPYQRPARQVPAPAAAPSAGGNAIHYNGAGSNCWAVILSGGYNAFNNHLRYWNDCSFIYSTLRQKYGYPRDQIITLISDGRDPGLDRNDGAQYVNSPIDLDHDGAADTDGPCTRAEIYDAFDRLGATLASNDQLLVFTTDHGWQVTNTHAALNLWNGEDFHDYDLEALTTNLPCPVMFVMEQCYSGGFVDNLDQPQRVITTAADYEHSSYAGDTWPDFNQYAYYWTAAVRGFFPGIHPWEDGVPCNADANSDGFVSFQEATAFAIANAYAEDTPQYQSNPEELGDNLFLIKHPSIALSMPRLALAGDLDGDGKADPAAWNAADNSWKFYLSGANYAAASLAAFGSSNGLPVFADFDGDGRPDPAFCPADGVTWQARLSGAGFQLFQFEINLGGAGWAAIAADMDGDGLADPIAYLESAGQWRALLSGAGYAPAALTWGGLGWLPAAADFDGDGRTDLALYGYASGNWLLAASGAGYAVSQPFPISVTQGAPAAGDFDGDGLGDLLVYLPDANRWCFNLSSMHYMYFQ